VSDKYEFIDAEYAIGTAAPTITKMCAWLEVSRSGFYEGCGSSGVTSRAVFRVARGLMSGSLVSVRV
jgi:hypothetical protein